MSRRFSGEWAELGILGEWIEGEALPPHTHTHDGSILYGQETTVRDLSGFYCKCRRRAPQQEPMSI